MKTFPGKFWDTLKFMAYVMTHHTTEQDIKDRIMAIRRKWGLET